MSSAPDTEPKMLAEKDGRVFELTQHDLERLRFRLNGRSHFVDLRDLELEPRREAS